MRILPKNIYEQFFIFEANKAQKFFVSTKNSCKSKFERLKKNREKLSKQ